MDSAIRFKTSRINVVIYVICLAIACYSILVTNLSFTLQLAGLALLTLISIQQNRQTKALRGYFRLTAEGLIPIEESLDKAAHRYRVRVLQRLPWCLNIEVKHCSGTFRQLVWKDCLAADDCRRFRAYLTELPAN